MAGNQHQESQQGREQQNQQQQQHETSDKGKRRQPGSESGNEPLTPSGNQHVATEE